MDVAALYPAVEEEFGVRIPPAARAGLDTPGQLIDWLAAHMPPTSETLDAEEKRAYVSALLCEVLAREVGSALFDEDEPWSALRP